MLQSVKKREKEKVTRRQLKKRYRKEKKKPKILAIEYKKNVEKQEPREYSKQKNAKDLR